MTDDELLAEAAQRFPPTRGKFYPLPWFNFLNQYRPAVTAELLCFRRDSAGLQVLLVDRQPSDTGYAGQCHTPGGYMLMGESEEAMLARIAQRELGTTVQSFRHAGIYNDPTEARGHHVHLLYLVEFTADPAQGHWAPVDHLPANLVPQFTDIIRLGAEAHTQLASL